MNNKVFFFFFILIIQHVKENIVYIIKLNYIEVIEILFCKMF